MRRLDAASSPTPPADAVRVPVRDPERVAVGPGQLADAHQVDQRVRLVAEYPQDARHRPVAQRRVQGQVPRAELDHAGPADHRRLAEGEQDQADGDSAAAPALDPLGILGRAQDRRQPLPDQAVLRSEDPVRICRGACTEVASVPMAYVFLPRDLADGFSPLSRAGAGRAGRAQSAARTARPGPSRLRRRSPTPPRPAASRGPPRRPGWPCAPRCGPRSATGPTVRCGRPARAQRRAGRGRRGGAPTGRRCRRARPRPEVVTRRPDHGLKLPAARPRTRSAARPIPPARSGAPRPPWASLSGVESTRQPPHLCREPGGLIWPPREHIGAGSTAGNRSDDRPGDVAQLAPGQRRGEQDEDVAAAARRARRRRTGRRAARAAGRARRPGGRRRRGAGSRSSASIRPEAEPGSYTGTVARLRRRLGRAAAGRDGPGRCGRHRGETRTCGVPAIEGVTARQAASAAARERPSGLPGSAVATPGVSHEGNVDLAVRPCYCGHGCWLSVRDPNLLGRRGAGRNERYAVVAAPLAGASLRFGANAPPVLRTNNGQHLCRLWPRLQGWRAGSGAALT